MRQLGFLIVLTLAGLPRLGWSQTPSPLQEWQYSSGIVLEKMFVPAEPDWHVVAGLGLEYKPLYDGAQDFRLQGGPVLNVRYRDIAFASIGEGLGVNFLRGDNYRAGVALTYDLGRRVSDDYSHLHGLPDISRAPVVKLFGSYVISKEFPLVLRGDLHQIIGGTGADGLVGDLEFYMPLPGSSKKLVMFAGPSVTFADRRYLQKVFGITAREAITSEYPEYGAHAGWDEAGFGFSATYFASEHWLINGDAAVDWLLGSASASPITQRYTQHVTTISVAYRW